MTAPTNGVGPVRLSRTQLDEERVGLCAELAAVTAAHAEALRIVKAAEQNGEADPVALEEATATRHRLHTERTRIEAALTANRAAKKAANPPAPSSKPATPTNGAGPVDAATFMAACQQFFKPAAFENLCKYATRFAKRQAEQSA